MRTGYAYTSLAFASSLIHAASAHFILKDTFVGQDFFNRWRWETFDDPTHGRVNYVDQEIAKQNNLSYGARLFASCQVKGSC